MTVQRANNTLLTIIVVCFLLGCTKSPEIRIRPSSQTKTQEQAPLPKDTIPISKPEEEIDTLSSSALDFAAAFTDEVIDTAEIISDTMQFIKPIQKSSEFLRAPSKMVRIALKRSINRIVLYSPGTVTIRDNQKRRKISLNGRISVTSIHKNTDINQVILGLGTSKKYKAFLPCTLLAKSTQNYIELNDQSYRGSIIITSGKRGTFTILNYCDVEEYLRGVVPLEIGKRKMEDFEAIKAQAIAARTYTYKKMTKKQRHAFDLLPTVADQVYGGVSVEYPLSDRAVFTTKDMVLTHQDTLIYAYYHSTCGGTTARIEDVWHKPAAPYLISIKDRDAQGKAYCAISRYFDWKERWPTQKLSTILRTYSKKNDNGKKPFLGSIRKMAVRKRFSCGRVSLCAVASSKGTFHYGGDKIRFIFRRAVSGYPILRSAKFKIQSINNSSVTLVGRGYGHGVGMCQMGAIGRARAGQQFEEIVSAYYQGTTLSKIVR